MEDLDYIQKNKATWNLKAEIHMNSAFYDLPGFLDGKTSLNDIELSILGDISNLNILHLQCHFGQDSISLARLGANVTGVDFSDIAIEKAKELTLQTETNCEFICCDIYDLPNHLHKQFDIVYTSYGTIGWLPDLDKWAEIVSRFLKPNGKFVFVEFHPVVWMFDNDFEKIGYNYFNVEPIKESEIGTYADKSAQITTHTISWNHNLGEVVNSLLSNGLVLNSLNEYDYSPYNCFNCTEEIGYRKFRIKHLENKIPMVYSIVAVKS